MRRCVFKVTMPESDRLSGCLDEINLEFVEREATPRLLMKLSIQLHLAELPVLNTVSFLEVFGVDRVRSTVYNWIHKADLQPESDRSPNHVAVDETVIQLDDEQYWLYATVDPGSNDLLHTKLDPTRTNMIADQFFAELREKNDVDAQSFSLMTRFHFTEPVKNMASISDTNGMEIGTA